MWDEIKRSEMLRAIVISALTAAIVVSCSKENAVGASNGDGVIGITTASGTFDMLERKDGALRVCRYGISGQGGTAASEGCFSVSELP